MPVLPATDTPRCGARTEATVPPPGPEAGARFAPLDAVLADLEERRRVRLGVLAHDPGRGLTYARRADDRFAMCSTFKVYAAAAILRLESQGSLRLDNTAGNLLLRRLGGPTAVTAFARSLGDTVTTLDRWEPELNSAEPGDVRDTSTASGLARGYRELLLGSGLPAAGQQTLTGWMRASVTSGQRIRAGLPAGWTAADKSGAGRYGTVNDAGVLWSPDGSPLVLVLLSDSVTGLPDAAHDNAAIAEATAVIVESLTR
ncbi:MULTISPECIES: serine hydrolase [unclassified Rhodococcus (in: high G+C Gram-positive bacteria)]|uniref:serine hydrolase n=1 Tax=unclassified Rhodococcus (in: high G+C Gram-positive bacteria) TaxID=192944 RepID=UPI003FA378E2